MKVFIWPEFGSESGQGGIKRVCEALRRYLPEYGVEIVSNMEDADVVNVHADDIKTDLPVAASLHGLYWGGFEWDNWCYEANQRLIKVAKRAQAVSVPSRWVHNSFARGMLLDPFVLPHGIDTDQWDVQENKEYILWAKTRPDPICDPTPVFELASRAKDNRFITTFGGGDLTNVTRLGKLNYYQSKSLVQQAAVYLGTTMETGGITVLESMVSGVPVLGFNWGVNPELIVHEETGYLVEPGDYDALYEGLLYCIEHRERLGAAARQHVIENFQWKDRVSQYLPFFQAALDNNVHPVKISVVVTAYNLESYLPACLDSILNQSFTDWECIIIDDVSPDRCGEIADEYATRDPRFRVVHNTKNRYLAESRNIGLRCASGRYILSLDADDQISVDTLAVLSESLDKNRDIDIVTGSFELVEPDGRHWMSGWPTSSPSFLQQRQKRNQVPYASMYRKFWFDRSGGYRRRYKSAEDADNWLRLMSYGAVPAKVTNMPTLVYANRPDSMSHSIAEPDWTAWSTWCKIEDYTPFGAAVGDEKYSQNVHIYGPPKISVVIPCGPGHDFYLQDALDSLIAQTFLDWECIVVNDTGHSWYNEDGKMVNPYLAGFPFVRIIDSAENHGVSWARNQGIRASVAPVFVLLDADDFMQPMMLDSLYIVWRKYAGWVYSDWYDHEGTVKTAQPWSATGLVEKMLGPSTGLYMKEDWEAVGGFDEECIGWEDWLFQLALLEKGVCGSHVARPLFTYRYDTGTRREDNFTRQKEILQYVREKHKSLLKGEFVMACGRCGGGGGQQSVQVGLAQQSADTGMILVEYVGPAEQRMTLRSRVNPKARYRYGGVRGSSERKFFVYAGDLDWLLANINYRRVEVLDTTIKVPVAPATLTAETRDPSPDDISIDALGVRGEVLTVLKRAGYATIGQLRRLSLTEMIAVPGMGPARARKVQDAISSYA